MRARAAMAAALLCAGCATTPPALLPSAGGDEATFSVSGRYAVRYGDEGGSGTLSWQHSGDEDDLAIRSPIGANIAVITRDQGVYSLATANRGTETSTDPDALTKRVLGWPLPLRGMPYWVRGRTAPQDPIEGISRSASGDIERLRQGGWEIDIETRHAQNGLPERMTLSLGDLRIRLLLEAWSTR